MFPPSLHKNIRELDKQITLLESECDNMEAEKRRKTGASRICFAKMPRDVSSAPCSRARGGARASFPAERPFVTGPRVSGSPKKSLPRRLLNGGASTTTTTTTSNDAVKRGRACPICGRNREPGKKGRRTAAPGCVCVRDGLTTNESDETQEKQVLHKGILHPNPGGTIEVTVTQKSHKPSGLLPSKILGKGCEVVDDVAVKEGLCLGNGKAPAKLEGLRAQKWSEILCQKRGVGSRSNKVMSRDGMGYSLGGQIMDQFKLETGKHFEGGDHHVRLKKCSAGDNNDNGNDDDDDNWNDENECPQMKAKLKGGLLKRKKVIENVIDGSPKSGKSFDDKQVQCGSDVEKSVMSDESFDPLRTLYNLIHTLKGNHSHDENKRLLTELEVALLRLSGDLQQVKDKGCGDDEGETLSQDSEYVRKLQENLYGAKKLCEKLMREKNKLSEDIAVKDRLLLNLSTKEREYLSIITSLKASLEKRKTEAEENGKLIGELAEVKMKLANETKVAEALRKSHAKMQEQLHKFTLENDKLKTEIRLNKLESEKFCVLIAGKDAEIKRYRDEVEAFQRQITEQLAALRSSTAANEVQKAMEAIVQQSHGFNVTDLDSAFSETQDERGTTTPRKHRDKLLHSSPTSTKSSVANTSWNRLSSIHETDSNILNLNITEEEEEEVLIGDKRKHADVGNCNKDVVLSFASCRSADEAAVAAAMAKPREKGDKPDKFRRDIEELFHDLKRKCSNRVLSMPSESVIFEDLFSSDTSDLSELSSGYVAGGKSAVRT